MSRNKKHRNFLTDNGRVKVLNLGHIVAEHDGSLMLYYVARERFVDRALDFNDPVMFFVGPKGAGKSAVLQMVRLINAEDPSVIVNISPDDLAFSSLANVQATTPIM